MTNLQTLLFPTYNFKKKIPAWVLVYQDGHKGNYQKNLRWQI